MKPPVTKPNSKPANVNITKEQDSYTVQNACDFLRPSSKLGDTGDLDIDRLIESIVPTVVIDVQAINYIGYKRRRNCMMTYLKVDKYTFFYKDVNHDSSTRLSSTISAYSSVKIFLRVS